MGAAIVIFAVLYGLYSHQVKVELQVQELLLGPRIAGGQRAGGARADLNKDTPAGWIAAETSLKQALDMQPSNPVAVADYADVETMLVSAGFADRTTEADVAVARAEAKDVTLAERYEAAALRMVQQGKPSDAEGMLASVMQRYGASNPRFLDAQGVAQRADCKLSEARMSFKRAQDIEWRAARKVSNYATALLEDGNAVDALAAYDRALQANGDHLRSMIGKARAFAALARAGRNTDVKAAIALCDNILVRTDKNEVPPLLRAQALSARAELKLASGDAAGAAKDANDAKALAPDDAATLRALAYTSTSGAAALWTAAAAKDKCDASIYFDGALALSAGNDSASAEKLLSSFAAQLPKTARYYLALAQLQLARADTKDADIALGQALAIEPANALLYFEQGKVAQVRKDPKAAAAAYEHAAQLRDDMPEIYRQMGVLYLESKQKEEGLRAMTDALARYKAARAPDTVMEPFYAQVADLSKKAGIKPKVVAQWVKEAREAH